MKKIILITLAFILTACSSSSTPKTGLDREPQEWTDSQKADLRRNQRKWKDANISHYRYNFSQAAIFWSGPDPVYTIEVQDGVVVSVTNSDGSAITDRTSFQTMDELFSMLKSGGFGKGDTVTVGYDPTYGFPLTISRHYKDIADGDSVIYFSKFEVLP